MKLLLLLLLLQKKIQQECLLLASVVTGSRTPCFLVADCFTLGINNAFVQGNYSLQGVFTCFLLNR